MSCFILSALFGAVIMTIVFAGADAVDWTRFRAWVSVQYEKAALIVKTKLKRNK
jgi:hypothetical protein